MTDNFLMMDIVMVVAVCGLYVTESYKIVVLQTVGGAVRAVRLWPSACRLWTVLSNTAI